MPFPKEYLNEIRNRLSVSSVVSKKVKLNKRGKEYLGLSPFNVEKTPSFTVNDNEGFYKCFSSGEFGDIFTFVMKTEGLSFPEAVERLALEAGLEVFRDTQEDNRVLRHKKELYNAVECATRFFQSELTRSSGKHARQYLAERGITEEISKKFRLGFAPKGNSLKFELLKKFSEKILLETRLLGMPTDGRDSFDFFRNRIMFPIFDFNGKPIAFGGRVIDGGQPKYLNSPETPLFSKGSLLYGYNLARETAFNEKEFLVTEGYMDVLSMFSNGKFNVVASLGTALTEMQIKKLWKTVPEPTLCFDGDRAGRKAALRVAERILPFLKPGFSINFTLLPSGKDPDDIVNEGGIDKINSLISNSLSLSEVIWSNKIEGRLLDTPERRAAVKSELKNLIDTIENKDVHSEYKWYMNEQYYNYFRNNKKNGFQGEIIPNAVMQVDSVRDIRHRILISTLINHPELLDYVEERVGGMHFENPVLNHLRQEILRVLSINNNKVDRQSIREYFDNSDLGIEFDKLMSKDLYVHAAFARPEATLEEAKDGWDDTHYLCHIEGLKTHIKDASGDFAEEPSIASFERFRQLFDEGKKSFEN